MSDRNEPISLLEPLLIRQEASERIALQEQASELVARSAALKSSLLEGTSEALARLLRAMNCYYSNLIEGHHTHPVDIESALKADYSHDSEKRDLQLEAQAHVNVQEWIDSGGLSSGPTTRSSIQEIHQRFCQELPPKLLTVKKEGSEEDVAVVPGAWRAVDVQVGRHLPISPGAIPRFMKRYEEVYAHLGKFESCLAVASAHHRLLWIHPFVDGNGRVARLVSHAQLLTALTTGSLWSIARGYARNVDTYKVLLAHNDLPRRNSLDGRGHLSEEGLIKFTHFTLEVCLDQIDFMEKLIEPKQLRVRIMQWVNEEIQLARLSSHCARIVEVLLYHGELPRAELGSLLQMSSRQARRIITPLMDKGAVVSSSKREPYKLGFPATLAPRWMPGLFPPKES